MFVRIVAVLTVLFFVPPSYAMPSNNAAAQESVESWTIAPTQRHILKSEILDRNVRIQVTVPAGYDPEKETYPVVYFPDDFVLGGIVRETSGALTWEDNIPSVITVGIEMEVNTRDEWFKERAYILTPSQSDIYAQYGVQKSWSGGGKKFLESLEDEIIPFIEAHYATKANDRAIVGHSFGGLFALYALFEKPSLFNRYLISSPSLPWDDRIMFDIEEAFSSKNSSLMAKIFLSVGGLEDAPNNLMVRDLKDMANLLNKRNYKGLELTTKIFRGENHMSVRSPAYNEGLKIIYASEAKP